MMNFKEPIIMPRGTHFGNNYWEVYSSKIKRKVCLFSNLEYENFLTLELNPKIEYFCEQPLDAKVIIDGEETKTIFDFWVKYKDGTEEMQVKYSELKQSVNTWMEYDECGSIIYGRPINTQNLIGRQQYILLR